MIDRGQDRRDKTQSSVPVRRQLHNAIARGYVVTLPCRPECDPRARATRPGGKREDGSSSRLPVRNDKIILRARKTSPRSPPRPRPNSTMCYIVRWNIITVWEEYTHTLFFFYALFYRDRPVPPTGVRPRRGVRRVYYARRRVVRAYRFA